MHTDFYPTVKAPLRHKSVLLGFHMGQGLTVHISALYQFNIQVDNIPRMNFVFQTTFFRGPAII